MAQFHQEPKNIIEMVHFSLLLKLDSEIKVKKNLPLHLLEFFHVLLTLVPQNHLFSLHGYARDPNVEDR